MGKRKRIGYKMKMLAAGFAGSLLFAAALGIGTYFNFSDNISEIRSERLIRERVMAAACVEKSVALSANLLKSVSGSTEVKAALAEYESGQINESCRRFLDELMKDFNRCGLLVADMRGNILYSRFKEAEYPTADFFASANSNPDEIVFGTQTVRKRPAVLMGESIMADWEKIGIAVFQLPADEMIGPRSSVVFNIKIDGNPVIDEISSLKNEYYESEPGSTAVFGRKWTIRTGLDRKEDSPLNRQFLFRFILTSAVLIIVWMATVSATVEKVAIVPFMNVFLKVKELSQRGGDLTQRIPVASNDEVGWLAIYLNKFIKTLKSQMEKVKRTSGGLDAAVRDLSASSEQVRSTSSRQAAAVKEVVTTMEDSDRLSKAAASRIEDVARIAEETREYVEEGFTVTKENRDKMDNIRSASGDFIEELRSLGGQIKSIWEIVGMINNVADQTRIIAFNAELEASAAGEAGKNFEIVASEIRRLANNTRTSTKEIKARIDEIQRASESLIDHYEAGGAAITEGWELSARLEQVFQQILKSADSSARSAHMISLSVNQQASGSEEILKTLKELSAGIESLVESARHTARASENLLAMSEELGAVVNEYIV